MSRDPIRLADQSDPPSPEAEYVRRLLRAQPKVRPTVAKMDELADRLGPILQPKSPSPAPGMTWLSASVAVAAVAALAVVTVAVRTTSPTGAVEVAVSANASAEEEAAPLPVEPAPAPDAPRAVSVDALPTATATATVTVNARKVPAVAAPRCDEVMLVDDADTALRSGNPERALAIVREIEQRCTAGVLVQERERIAIEALAKAGRVEQARARARTFEARFPTSPHLRRVRQVTE